MRLLQIGSAFWQSRALHVAGQLDLATVLGDQSRSLDDLAQLTHADAAALGRLLRFLLAMGLFEQGADGRFRNNSLTQHLRRDRAGGVRHLVQMHNASALCRPWYETLEQGVRTGQVPFELCHGEPLFDYMSRHAELDALFAGAMDEVESLGGDSFATAFDWGRFEHLIDLGGNKGAKAAAILRHHPQLRATVFDRPQAVAQARAWWGQYPLQGEALVRERLQFVAGELLAGPLPAAASSHDVYLLSAVLHAFDDEQAAQVLCQVVRAAGTCGALIVLLELVLPDTEVDLASASFDMQMFMGTRGRERTLSEWQSLFSVSGVALLEEVQLASFGSLLVLQVQGGP